MPGPIRTTVDRAIRESFPDRRQIDSLVRQGQRIAARIEELIEGWREDGEIVVTVGFDVPPEASPILGMFANFLGPARLRIALQLPVDEEFPNVD